MYLTFNSQKSVERTASPASGEQRRTKRRNTPYAPHLANACNTYEVQVEERPETTESEGEHVWIVDQQPPHSLARGHVITLRSTSTEIVRSGRISTVTLITRHWITVRLTGGHANTYLRTPTSWIKLGKLDRFVHTELYESLPGSPEPHHSFSNRPTFADDQTNPYQFEQDPRDADELREKLRGTKRLKQTLDGLKHGKGK
ncbi:uncharacterized protein C8Q71DRAFT_858145 [Rhodofomes roseus]|uniref:Uncharacterized protein n=1 Tax=Rhodofomes roseus TaxID=34475 RepID=A0ABQ8KEI8_9APHY|nr:uncharacterized protein C8Q71DRAFT_858145 [Rhodofomes roseus]KAH9836139.1 hypothetical protein C8Q71DRAFT_858145 [Rhodofomes roseus]